MTGAWMTRFLPWTALVRFGRRAEKGLHLPYFAGVALHYGLGTLIGGTAAALFLVGLVVLFAGEEA